MVLDTSTVEGRTIKKFIGNFNIYEKNPATSVFQRIYVCVR